MQIVNHEMQQDSLCIDVHIEKSSVEIKCIAESVQFSICSLWLMDGGGGGGTVGAHIPRVQSIIMLQSDPK